MLLFIKVKRFDSVFLEHRLHIFFAKAIGATDHVDTLIKCKEALERSAGREYY